MNNSYDKKSAKDEPKTQNQSSDDCVQKAPEDAIKEPGAPVPAVDDVKPPLKGTLGGDDVATPQEKTK